MRIQRFGNRSQIESVEEHCRFQIKCEKATPRGFEPLRAEPNGFRVHLLNRSDTVSVATVLSRMVENRRSEAAIG